MQKNLSFGALSLLKFTINHTGEKEIGLQGVEIYSSRRLNGEESAQRRFFIKAFEPIDKEVTKKINELQEIHNSKVKERRKELKRKNLKREEEKEEEYTKQIENLLNGEQDLLDSVKETKEAIEKLSQEKYMIEVSDKVWEFCKKYFKKFGDDHGFVEGDDEMVMELNEVL